ncbi:MAG TPA: hypothetical protein VK804_17775, partial [Bradyrhizobium sp.]|uniref:hypothetical protein n=1 Tax=Bradyrhizobium sp. TaxID=376 RepID=UPI002C95A2CB
ANPSFQVNIAEKRAGPFVTSSHRVPQINPDPRESRSETLRHHFFNSLLMHASARTIGASTNLTESVIWVLDPVAWNRTALSDVSYSGGALSTADEDIKSYAPRAATMKVHPVALYGAHNSPRIVAQQGVFTIFGTGQAPMEELVGSGTFPQTALTKIVVAPSRIRRIRKSLLNQGVTEAVVFPDLEGLALETKRHFGFEG